MSKNQLKPSILAIFGVTFGLLWSAQLLAQNADRFYEDHLLYDDYLEITTSDGKVAITPYSEKIVEVQFLTELHPANPPSRSVAKTQEAVAANLEEGDDSLTYSTSGLSVTVMKEPFQLKFHYKGKALVSENQGYFEKPGTVGFKFNLDDNEVLYGGGERALDMNRRGRRLPLYNTPAYGYGEERDAMYYSLPIVISSNKYMILWDNAPKGALDLGHTEKNVLSVESIGGRTAYYVVAGDDFYDLNDEYTDLTGKQPLPPRWTLGNFASRFGYRTQKQSQDVVDTYIDEEIPLDSIVIDLYWFGKDIQGHMGNLAWDYEAWPKPEKMMKRFNKQGVKTVLITEPFVLKTSKRWQEAVDADIFAKDYKGKPYIFDFYFGTSGLIDIFKPEAKAWFWDIYKELTLSGVDAWWGDLGEPESHPGDMVHVAGTGDMVHNIYGHEWAKMMYEGYRKDFPKKRPFVLMRAGFAGSQRYGMVPWSGDVTRDWPGLKAQPKISLQMGMQGLGYMHSDLGGFADHYVDDVLQKDAELYTRWLQYGVFQPVFRPHSQESVAPEPIFWDDKTKALSKAAVELRYQLFPYNYTLAYENAAKGYPFMRPLFYNEPNNAELYDYSEAYLWGENILVSPVLEKGATTQSVYFPKGSDWIDFYSSKSFKGGSTAAVNISEENIPTFVRAGAFIPMAKAGLQSSDSYSSKTLALHYYADHSGKESQYTLYDDDGETSYSIVNGKHELLSFTGKHSNGATTVTMSSNGGKFKGRPSSRQITLHIHNLKTQPTSVMVNDKEVTSVAVSESEIAIPFTFKSKEVSIQIK